MDYKNDIHKRIFEDQIAKNPCRCGNEYLAALYLLTADKTLWNASKHVIEDKLIDFTLIDIKGMDLSELRLSGTPNFSERSLSSA